MLSDYVLCGASTSRISEWGHRVFGYLSLMLAQTKIEA
jgi:hypothetical protein